MDSSSTLSDRFRRRFARRTSSGRFIAEIDGLRFPAIAIVVIGHLSSFFLVRGAYGQPRTLFDRIAAAPERFAGEGVVLFFVISGFVLALPFAQYYCANGDPVSLRSYFLRRLTRLEPPYLVTLAALVGLETIAATHHIAGRAGSAAAVVEHGAVSAAYLHNVIFAAPSTINPPAWSLEIEVQFYILVPVLAAVFRIRSNIARRAVLVAGALAFAVIQGVFGATHPRVALSIVGQLQYFLMGFLLADLYLFAGVRDARHQVRWDLVSLVGWTMIFGLWQRGAWASVVLPFVVVVTFIAVFCGPLTNRVFTSAWIATLGGMCYSIYLLHFELIAAFARLTRRVIHPTGTMWLDMIVDGLPVLAVTLGICVGFFYFIERPCMDRTWPKRLVAWARRTTGIGGVSTTSRSPTSPVRISGASE